MEFFGEYLSAVYNGIEPLSLPWQGSILTIKRIDRLSEDAAESKNLVTNQLSLSISFNMLRTIDTDTASQRRWSHDQSVPLYTER